jgi:hypothetical protein
VDHNLSSPLQPRYSITTHDSAPIKQLAHVRRPAVPVSPTSRTCVTPQVLSDYKVVMLCAERRILDEISLSCEHWLHMHTTEVVIHLESVHVPIRIRNADQDTHPVIDPLCQARCTWPSAPQLRARVPQPPSHFLSALCSSGTG